MFIKSKASFATTFFGKKGKASFGTTINSPLKNGKVGFKNFK
jgi:hypothetical protein